MAIKIEDILLNPTRFFPNTTYEIIFHLDYQKIGTGQGGHHFRTLIKNTSNDYTFIELIPTELMPQFFPLARFSYSLDSKTKTTKIFRSHDPSVQEFTFSFKIDDLNSIKPIKEDPVLFNFISSKISADKINYYKEEIERQKVFVVNSENGSKLYIPSTVIATYFCFLSSKFITNFFKGTLSDLFYPQGQLFIKKVSTEPTPEHFIILKQKMSNLEALILYLYSTNLEFKKTYDDLAKKFVVKLYKSKKEKNEVRFVFSFPLPLKGNWKIKAYATNVDDTKKAFLLCKILEVNLKELTQIDNLKVFLLSKGKKEGAPQDQEQIKIPAKKIEVQSTKFYSSNETLNKDYSVEIAEDSIRISKENLVTVEFEVISMPGVASRRIFFPTTKESKLAHLTTIESFEPSEGKRLIKKVTSLTNFEPKDERLSLELIDKLISKVERLINKNFESYTFDLQIVDISGTLNVELLKYKNGKPRKLKIYSTTFNNITHFYGLFLDQIDVVNPVSYPLLFSSKVLQIKDLMNYFYIFLRTERDDFRRILKQNKIKVHFKKTS